jgi:hypothetical protein
MDNLLQKLKSLPDGARLTEMVLRNGIGYYGNPDISIVTDDLKSLATNHEELVEAAQAITQDWQVFYDEAQVPVVLIARLKAVLARIEGRNI